MKIFSLSLLIGLTSLAFPQEIDLEKLSELGKPGEMHRILNTLSGTWDVKAIYKIGSGPEMEGTATCEAKWMLDGRILSKEYKSTMMGQPFTVQQYLGYDNFRQKFFEIQFGSDTTSYLHNVGTISENKKTITLIGDSLNPFTLKPAKLRVVYILESTEKYTMEWHMPNAEGKEEKMVTLIHTKKKT